MIKTLVAAVLLAVLRDSATAMDALTKSVADLTGAMGKVVTDSQMKKSAQWAASLSMQKDNFWHDALKNAQTHYTPHFGRLLNDRFNEVHLKDPSPTLVDFYEKVQEQVMQQGGKQFQARIGDLKRLLGANRDLALVTDGYKVNNAENQVDSDNALKNMWSTLFKPKSAEDYDSDLAKNIAHWVNEHSSTLRPIENFAQFVEQNNPCKSLEQELAKPGMEEYAKYLSLAAIPEYYVHTPLVHVANVNLLAACNRLKSEDIIKKAEHFYRMYYAQL